MADENLSLVIHKANDLRLENTVVPEPGKGEVQVRMSHVGICGSDVHLWRYGSLSPQYPVNEPFILGHEISGVISKLGEGVTNVCVGNIFFTLYEIPMNVGNIYKRTVRLNITEMLLKRSVTHDIMRSTVSTMEAKLLELFLKKMKKKRKY